ncbi:CzcE family metal-binding protein [Hydrogenophaga laconesensis]|jgi:hypothetical protein|uniref:Heavy-metal resistance protein CzcE n=2 Tax=Hydrogenophaga TaxID=47420 RepID=A0ABU1VI65_9BURK|nr:CzcE family metal-binding protein [Hydrogenophaga laconesensis]MDR7097176.1 hypothetical protein [Hydrogenophaga laconesensis]
MKALSTLRIAAIAVAFTSTLGAVSAAETFRNGQSVQGQSAGADAGSRIVDVESTKFANVKYGETVSFVGAGGKKFSWTFNGLDGRSWDLAQFAPAGFTSKDYRVYVTKNPLYRR